MERMGERGRERERWHRMDRSERSVLEYTLTFARQIHMDISRYYFYTNFTNISRSFQERDKYQATIVREPLL